MAEKSGRPSYADKISNKGAQFVEAPIPQSAAKQNKVTKGKDLRAGRGK